jgi:hypothetical protein
MLQRFVQPGYEKLAQRGNENFYRQAFELAVAHLRLQPTLMDLT